MSANNNDNHNAAAHNARYAELNTVVTALHTRLNNLLIDLDNNVPGARDNFYRCSQMFSNAIEERDRLEGGAQNRSTLPFPLFYNSNAHVTRTARNDSGPAQQTQYQLQQMLTQMQQMQQQMQQIQQQLQQQAQRPPQIVDMGLDSDVAEVVDSISQAFVSAFNAMGQGTRGYRGGRGRGNGGTQRHQPYQAPGGRGRGHGRGRGGQ